MKRTCVQTLICCLLISLLLIGCGETDLQEPPPEKELSANDISGDYVCLDFNLHHLNVTNPQGKELHWTEKRDRNGEFIAFVPPPIGDMECYGYFHTAASTDVWVPYSKAFTVQTRTSPDITTRFAAEFNQNGARISDINFSANLEGTVTLSDDNTVEVDGEHSRISVYFSVWEGNIYDYGDLTSKYRYILDGGAGENAKIRLEGDEVTAEGMTEGYTVTKLEYGDWIGGKEVWVKEYPADSEDS